MYSIDKFITTEFPDHKNLTTDMAVPCPFCITRVNSEDTGYHLQISVVKQAAHCWRCDYSSNWVTLIQDVTGCSTHQAMAKLYVTPKPLLSASDALASLRPMPSILRSNECTMPDEYIPLLDTIGVKSLELNAIRNYLKRRGFKPSTWFDYGLGYVPGKWRVYIPIESGFWQARAIMPHMKPKYMSPSTPASDVLFNSKALDAYNEIVVCEGALSAMAVGSNAIAMIGKNPTPQRIERIACSRAKKVIIAFEAQAWSILRLAKTLRARGKIVEIWDYGTNDPADWVEPTKRVFNFESEVLMRLFQ